MSDPRDVLTRPAREPDMVIAYGAEPDQVAEVRLPKTPGAPLVLFFHGGFWRAEYDLRHVAPLAADLADHGYAVVTVEYRRTGQPGGGWPGTFDDVGDAVRRLPGLVAAAAQGRVDTTRTVLAGHSAGGHLALWAASAPRSDPATASVLGVLALAPVCDLRAAYHSDLGDGAVAALHGGSPAQYPERYATTDPMLLTPATAPILLLHGTHDRHVPISQSRGYAAVHGRSRVTLIELTGAEHFALIDPESTYWPHVVSIMELISTGMVPSAGDRS